jgi:hypothetical protein
MSQQANLFGRMTRWFRQRFAPQQELPLLYGQTETPTALARRPFFPWNRREEDLSALQGQMTSMAALMTSLRQYLDQQNARHDELLTYLSQLSQALQAIPDSSRVQSETLRVLHQQIAFQNAQHKQLFEMVRKISEHTSTQHDVAELLRDRVETLYKNDQELVQTIRAMGQAMDMVSNRSQTNGLVLDRLRDNLVSRDGDLERAIRRENHWVRGTLLVTAAVAFAALVIAIAISVYSYSAISKVADSVYRSRPIVAPHLQPEPAGLDLTLSNTPSPTGSGTQITVPSTLPAAFSGPATRPTP